MSILNENEKLALLELYKREYERTHPNDKKIMATEDADDNDQTSDVSNLDDESEMQIEDVEPQEENIESQETKLVEETIYSSEWTEESTEETVHKYTHYYE